MRYYYKKKIMRAVLGQDSHPSLLRNSRHPLALVSDASGHRTIGLLGCDAQQSLVIQLERAVIKPACYPPYGYTSKPTLMAFQGEYVDPVSKNYPMGAGYRWLIPTLRRFNSPDSLSPFYRGGINAYAFVSGDPINYNDPSAHVRGLAHLHVPRKSNTVNDAGLTLFTHKRFLGKKTLYVIAHGSGSQAVVGGRKMANADLFSHVKTAVKDLNTHDDFFMNICTSADPNPSTGQSLGQAFANHFNLEGIAFSGNVKGNLEVKTSKKGWIVNYEVHTKNYLRPNDPGYDRFNYQPVKIRPSSSVEASALRAL